MALALYRRYRPDTFEGVIGQDQVTVPLMRALDEGKLTHAYLFSGPRGCGKTSSARILARCVNCAKGPTSHPCGECESCKDLATGGPGSIDVVEIDAASHNGVDDARELRERAGFAPARDRYKIFILDEAHMVTQQGFNALLKIVEEPPEHVMFIFATTEPDKVIGTIRSRTHHYPFRLVPQEVMGPYLEQICAKEGIKPEPGVLKLAMRAGGGSMRDTLSVLDQLMVGSVEGVITHDAAVALLGFTPEALIGEAVDAVIAHDGEALYAVIQKVVVGGFDPRRFVEDLLARVRDLLVLTLAGDRAESVLSDTAEAEDMADLHRQASALGLGALTGMAEIINATLGSMTGAISPRMRLELLAARLLAGSESGFAAGVPGAAGGAAGAPVRNVGAASGPSGSADAAGRNAQGGFAGSSHGGFSGATRNQQTAQAASASEQSPSVAQSGSAVQSAGTVAGQTAGHAANNVSGDWNNAGFADDATGRPGAPATVAPQAAPVSQAAPAVDNRSVDEKWDAVVAALPETIREYVSRDKVPTVKFGPNRKGLPCLSMTFDQSLSQHAFALAVDNSGKKAATVVMDAVRDEFGANAVIAPTVVAANGERVESVKRMSPEQLAKVKQQIAMAKAGLAAASLGGGLGGAAGVRAGSEPKTAKASGASQEDGGESHRAGANAGGAAGTDSPAEAHHEHHKKHVPVPDVSDGIDPWGISSSAGTSSVGAQSVKQPVKQPVEHAVKQSDDPWNQPVSAEPSDDPWSQPQHQSHGASAQMTAPESSPQKQLGDPWNQPMPQPNPADDPWNQPAPSAGADNDPWNQPAPQRSNQSQPAPQTLQPTPGQESDPWNQPMPPAGPEPSDDPWNQPAPAVQSAPANDPWNQPPDGSPNPSGFESHLKPAAYNAGNTGNVGNAGNAGNQPAPAVQSAPEPQVDPDEDEYSMSDQSLGDATAMSLDDLKTMFEVKKVEEFAADDPRNPRNVQTSKSL
ncbi:DNA polymerase III subunit gamma and tau [Bifidobacterium scaligerum]|uniref:DNA-directed DNA polymerase n=1 Tax=Bifidobacterium scaligerum TaxID=2052656 RepID=A0A2M9HNP9_9BIFI|nr:DNA polymerase III subunit gamma and tau [Bifidobacterium scaligerum]PJM78427.1 DNA polymerase III subunit gamma/tau [Bifidobacterium scaligerum]